MAHLSTHARRLRWAAISTVATLALVQCKSRTATHEAAAVPLAPPTSPEDLLVTGHFGQPRTTVRALASLSGATIPFELGMSMMLGLDATLLTVVDLSKPIDVVITGSAESTNITLTLTPIVQARANLSTRFRFTTVPGLGDRLDPRADTSGREPGWTCAIVGVPGPVGTRVVCNTESAQLARVGRFAAFESQRHESEVNDARFEVASQGARRALGPLVQQVFAAASMSLRRTAAQAREQHREPPAFGDPEPIVRRFAEIQTDVNQVLQELTSSTVELHVEPDALSLDVQLGVSAGGQGFLARDSRDRVSAPMAHPLAARLDPTSALAVASRGAPAFLRDRLRTMLRLGLEVLGTRVPDAPAAQADLDALTEHMGDGWALSLARRQPPVAANTPAGRAPAPRPAAVEAVLLLAQDDEGAASRPLIASLARAPWLRGVRLGEQPLRLSTQDGGLIVRFPAAPTPAVRALSNDQLERTASPPRVPLEMGVASVQGAVAVVLSGDARAQLQALRTREAGAVLPILGGLEGSTVFGLEAGAMRPSVDDGVRAPLQLTWRAMQDGSSLNALIHVRASAGFVRTLRGARGEE
ncbi:MAG: hypothetical protein Q8Q09_21270 [Deltaproteobacteria bacterium]|nr:hypothetical protein [Deltaproteobacteria bacterium]